MYNIEFKYLRTFHHTRNPLHPHTIPMINTQQHKSPTHRALMLCGMCQKACPMAAVTGLAKFCYLHVSITKYFNPFISYSPQCIHLPHASFCSSSIYFSPFVVHSTQPSYHIASTVLSSHIFHIPHITHLPQSSIHKSLAFLRPVSLLVSNDHVQHWTLLLRGLSEYTAVPLQYHWTTNVLSTHLELYVTVLG